MKTPALVKTLVLFTILLNSCGKKDSSLLDRLPVEPIVNPETKVLLKDNNMLLYAQLESGNVIRGVTKKNTFQTSDFFKNFFTASYLLPMNGKLFFFDKNYIVGLTGYQTPTTVVYSTDLGNSWNSISVSLSNSSVLNYVDVINFTFLNNSTLLMLGGTTTYSSPLNTNEGNTWLYKVNLQTGMADSISGIKGYYPISIQFITSNTGWMLLNKILPQGGGYYSNQNTFITKTTDGGVTWSAPVMMDASARLNLVKGVNSLFLYNKNGGGYFSNDGGLTWTKSAANERLNEVIRIDDKILYATADAGFYKSLDNGNTWKVVSLYSYGKLSFVNEKEGIRYDSGSLYFTEDGGVNWKVLLYPFSYIIH